MTPRTPQRQWRKMYRGILTDPRWRGEPDAVKVAMTYVIVEASNRIGIFRFSVAAMADGLEWDMPKTEEAFSRVLHLTGWRWDETARMLWLPNWWRWNLPDAPSALQGYLTADLPACAATPLLLEFQGYLDDIPEDRRPVFAAAVHKALVHLFKANYAERLAATPGAPALPEPPEPAKKPEALPTQPKPEPKPKKEAVHPLEQYPEIRRFLDTEAYGGADLCRRAGWGGKAGFKVGLADKAYRAAADALAKLVRLDGYTEIEVVQTLRWLLMSPTVGFWQTDGCGALATLRKDPNGNGKKFDQIFKTRERSRDGDSREIIGAPLHAPPVEIEEGDKSPENLAKWKAFLEKMEAAIDPENFALWIAPTEFGGVFASEEDTSMLIIVPSAMSRNWLASHYMGAISAAAERAFGEPVEVSFEVREDGIKY